MQLTLIPPSLTLIDIKLLPAVFITPSTSASKHLMLWATMRQGPGS